MNSLSIIIPCFNEAKNIAGTLHEVLEALTKSNIDYEIIVIDDSSTDETYNVVSEILSTTDAITLMKNQLNIGFCNSYLVGVQHASKNYCMYVPGDNDLKAFEMEKIINAFGLSDVLLVNFTSMDQRFLHRRIISKMYTWLLNSITGNSFKYYNGFNVFRVKDLKGINIKTPGFSFQAEIILALKKENKTFNDVSVHCCFHDSKSSALKLKNIYLVSKYILNLFIKHRLKLEI